MKELSLHLLDIAQNSVKAGATEITLRVEENIDKVLTMTVADNGQGMDRALARAVLDPFTTSRTTRRVGLGLPLLQMTARQTGGDISLESEVGVGTTVRAHFYRNHIDCPPPGDWGAAVALLIQGAPHIRWIYAHHTPRGSAGLDTEEVQQLLGDVSLSEPAVWLWLQEYLQEQEKEITEE